jgi:hypothetical protein
VPLLLLTTWHRQQGSQELEFVEMVAMALVVTVIKNDVGELKKNKKYMKERHKGGPCNRNMALLACCDVFFSFQL